MKPFDQQFADKQQECAQLHAENARLIALLEKHGISHSIEPPLPAPPDTPPRTNSNLSTEQKIALFRRLFRGRTDVYPIRWEKKDGSKSGYTPACGNEWKVGLCDKKLVKCGECGNRLLLPLADHVIYDHLAGEHVVGVYPLLTDDTCHFLAADFDEADWRDDANQIYFEKAQLAQALMNRLIRLAAFQNPEFYRAQAMCRSTWEFPRIIGCAENHPRHIALPRGCLDAATKLLEENGIGLDLSDERFAGDSLSLKFAGQLRPDQEKAVKAMMAHDTGVLCAPTAFGKTVTAAALIARRGVSTLILVHRTELLKQWQERLRTFLNLERGDLGTIGAGKRKPSGKIDIAVMQSLTRKGEISDLIEQYGHIVVDECHHISAVSFDLLLRQAKARYVLGLTATPVRRDGQQPIIFMQCGPIRHEASRPEGAPRSLTVIPRSLATPLSSDSATGIQDIFRQLAASIERTQRIVEDVLSTYRSGRSIIVLTERTDHLNTLERTLTGQIENLFALYGRMSRKQRTALLAALEALPGDAPRVLLATGRLVGEGFDHPPLDTLMLAMPISWKGTLQQYAGRLHREHASKTDVLIYDYVDTGNLALERMWDKRQRGYRAMGYQIDTSQGKLC